MRLRLSALAALLLLVGCDSSSPEALVNISGTYRLAVLTFNPSAASVADANIASKLNTSGTTLQVFGDDDEALFTVPFLAGDTRRINLNVRANDTRATFTAISGEDRDDLEDLLLPSDFALDYSGSTPSTLTGTYELRGVNLDAFDRDAYQGLTSVDGTLTIRFNRQ
ncbi:hypothetical protein [Rubrivirga sp. IMCC43871]|uniref:hypothetical protein n=1 Tax=Rubrivirga sp. IMCC43871 TaxID=3391575 RepID=UPI00398FC930